MNKVGDKAVQKAPPATQEEQAIIRTRILTQVFTSKGEPPLRRFVTGVQMQPVENWTFKEELVGFHLTQRRTLHRLATAWVQFGRALGGAASDRAAKHQALLLELANIEYHVRGNAAVLAHALMFTG